MQDLFKKTTLNKHFRESGHNPQSEKENVEENTNYNCKICSIQKNFQKRTHFIVHNALVHSMIPVLHDIMHTEMSIQN